MPKHEKTNFETERGLVEYNVKLYGATGDGTTDDTSVITAVMALAGVNGGVVFFPVGTYLVTSSIVLKPNVIIQGSGKNNTIIKCPSNMSTAIFTKVMSTEDYLHDTCIRDLTMDGASGAATRGIVLDSSINNAIPYYNNFVSNVTFQNFYIAFYHGANNNGADRMLCDTTVMNCRFQNNAIGYCTRGTYGDWIDHCSFANNTVAAIMTPEAISGSGTPAVIGSAPGIGPTTICKVTNIDINNTGSLPDYTDGTDYGICMSVSHSTFSNIFISTVSCLPFAVFTSEPSLDNIFTDIRMYGCGGGLGLYSCDINSGGIVNGFQIESCGLSTQFEGDYPGRQMLLNITKGSWKIAHGKLVNTDNRENIKPAYAVALGDIDDNGLGNVSIEDVTLGTANSGDLTHLYTTQDSLLLSFRNCPGINPFGNQAISVPLSTVATATLTCDSTYYITAGASACTVVVSGQSSITIPASTMVAVFVPANATVTPTYTDAPTWVVAGN